MSENRHPELAEATAKAVAAINAFVAAWRRSERNSGRARP